MPHECTHCGRRFSDGSEEMLTGCPDCDGNTFQYVPNADAESPNSRTDEPATQEPTSTGAQQTLEESVESAVESGTGELPTTEPTAHAEEANTGSEISPEEDPSKRVTIADSENTAQADARSTIVSRSELPSHPVSNGAEHSGTVRTNSSRTFDGREPTDADANRDLSDARGSAEVSRVSTHGSETRTAEERDAEASPEAVERPSLEELRSELNDQFESIKILRPGQYEINLLELYDRDEYIVSLQEDGRYVIDSAGSWARPDE